MEVERFGLPSFKILGASWAVCRELSRRAGHAEPAATLAELRELTAPMDGLTLVAATDGNHGRAVAHMARLLGLSARILVPEHTARARIEAIAGEEAEVQVVRGSYDDAVELSAAIADELHVVISDTSWPGYEDVPGWVADGYATIFDELAEQLSQGAPPLVAVQIGVGALASAA
ncbi:MAG: diaminopropionate ammonia-lyase, partial [Solirubrobacteraceae bacterium]|nr:diaminopropionate ammonia-lyase [Solirubrobacteraceae bacterium]